MIVIKQGVEYGRIDHRGHFVPAAKYGIYDKFWHLRTRRRSPQRQPWSTTSADTEAPITETRAHRENEARIW